MIVCVYNNKTQEEIDVDYYEIKENVKSGANIAKKAFIINNNIILNKNYSITFVCYQCGKHYTQKYQKCFHKLVSGKPFCPTCTRKKAQSHIPQKTIEKRKQTHKERYGKWNNNSEKRKQTNLKKYGSENPYAFGTVRYKKVLINKYGVDNPLKSEEIQEKVKQTNLDKYGVENVYQSEEIKEKIKQTNLNKYGVEYPIQSEEIKERMKQTNLKKYGVENVYQSEEIKEKIKHSNLENYGVEYNWQREGVKEKIKQTLLEKYGDKNYNNRKKYKQTNLKKYSVENPLQNNEVKERIRQTNLKKYNVEYPLQNDEIRNKFKKTIRDTIYNRLLDSKRLKNRIVPLFDRGEYNGIYNEYKWQCINCNTVFESNLDNGKIPRCPTCYPKITNTSRCETELYDWLQSLDIKTIIQNDRTILNGKELDLYLPDYNLAIEFNGLYWHSELQGKDKRYHLQKTLECSKQNIDLIHIFEDEWIEKQAIVQSIIKSKLGLANILYARKCIVHEVNNQPDFLDNNHLQGSVNSKINIGLYHNDELISLLSLSKSRYNKQYDWEITRYANKLDTSVVGGFSRLIKYFKSKYNGNIITYSDKRYFDGSIYKNNGFEELESSKPNYYYTDYIQRFNRVGFQKHKLEEQLELYDSNLTEWENMQLNGWDRIWDCGNSIFFINVP